MEFAAIDVETANADMASVCQIGIALFRERGLADEWVSHVDPEDYFDPVNVSIHGIDEATVKGAPTFAEAVDRVYEFLDDRVSVCHTHFDRVAVQQACDESDLRPPRCVWLDSARVARRTWKEFAQRGYGLDNVCQFLGYDFKHHDALEDAKAAAHILTTAMEKTGLDLEGWLKRVEQPIDPSKTSSRANITREGNPDGPLYGEVLVFTGALESPRVEAAEMAAHAGCRVASGVTKKTTLLVVGDQDVRKLGGHEKSSKHRKAEALIAKGQAIRILRETDFARIASLAD